VPQITFRLKCRNLTGLAHGRKKQRSAQLGIFAASKLCGFFVQFFGDITAVLPLRTGSQSGRNSSKAWLF
jgi:hypothetical protein